MPKVNLCVPPAQKALRSELRASHGDMVGLMEIGTIIGIKNRSIIHEFVEGLRGYEIGKRTKWKTTDIADRLWEARHESY